MKIHLTANEICVRRILDSSRLYKYFRINGCEIVDDPSIADYNLFVTCASKKSHEDRCFKILDKLNKFGGQIIVLGCLPAIAKERLGREFKGITIPTKELFKIDDYFDFTIKYNDVYDFVDLKNPFFIKKLEDISDNQLSPEEFRITRNLHYFIPFLNNNYKEFYYHTFRYVRDRFKSFQRSRKGLKNDFFIWRICGGCNGKCSFCAIRNAIGHLKSKSIDQCMKEYKEILSKGYRLFHIIGDDPGAYGIDNNSGIDELLDEVSKIDKGMDVQWHLDDINPVWAIKYRERLTEEIKNGRIISMSVSLQSGSERVLKKMNRPALITETMNVLNQFKKANPLLLLKNQIIIGFPGETQEDFRKTIEFVFKAGFNESLIHPYSDREGVPSSSMKNKVTDDIKRRRLKEAIEYFDKKMIRWVIEEPDLNF